MAGDTPAVAPGDGRGRVKEYCASIAAQPACRGSAFGHGLDMKRRRRLQTVFVKTEIEMCFLAG